MVLAATEKRIRTCAARLRRYTSDNRMILDLKITLKIEEQKVAKSVQSYCTDV